MSTNFKGTREGTRDIDAVLTAAAETHTHAEASQSAQSPDRVARGRARITTHPQRRLSRMRYKSLTNRESIRKGKQGNPLVGKVRSTLLREEIESDDPNQGVHEEYLLNDRNLPWHAPLGKILALAVHKSLVLDLTSLIHSLYAHLGVVSTLDLIHEGFHWPNMARDVREYVISCRLRRRKRSTSQKIAMLPSSAIQPRDVLAMDSYMLVDGRKVASVSRGTQW